ncbi:MAG: hypothetical protein QOE01_2331 [Actinomycetota bacterium]|jgi:hypothetical protein|nr:hypothetical protein [Actinomycetota bacterium]
MTLAADTVSGSGDPRVPGPGVAGLEDLPAGPELAAVIASVDVRALSGFDLVSLLSATERLTAWSQATQLAAIAEVSRRPQGALFPPDADARRGRAGHNPFAAMDVPAELGLSRWAAEDRLGLAVCLDRLPAAQAALAGGRIDLAKVRALVSGVDGLPDAEAAAVASHVLVRGPDQLLGAFRESVRRAVLRADPTAAERRHRKAVQSRRVELVPLADGMAGLWAVDRADRTAATSLAITGLAEEAKAPGDTRTLAQRRADVLADFGDQTLRLRNLPRRQRRRTQLQVAVAATTLLGLDEEPGELAGYGPIPASLARELAGDATWRRLLTDPTSGVVTDYGTTTYQPPASLADLVIAKRPRCGGLGCRQPARCCQLDHAVPFPHGPTAEPNLGPLCQHDHIDKHKSGWRYQLLPDGSVRWTSPSGHVHTKPPEPLLEPPPERSGDASDAVGSGRPAADDAPPTSESPRRNGDEDAPPF